MTVFTYLMDRWLTDLIAAFPFLSLPDVPYCGPTGHKSLHHAVRDLLLFHLGWGLCLISWLSFIFNSLVFYFTRTENRETFSPEFRLRKFIQSDCFVLFSPAYLCLSSPCTFTVLCTFTLLHFMSFLCFASPHPTVLPSLPVTLHPETIPYPLITPSDPHWVYTSIEPFFSLFLILATPLAYHQNEKAASKSFLDAN